MAGESSTGITTQNGVPKLKFEVGQNLLARGTCVWVRVGESATDCKVVGFVDSMRGSKQIQTQKAQVCGSIMCASIDPQALSCSIAITGFVATKDVYKGTETYNGKGEISLASFNPNSEDYIKGQVCTKFAYMDFWDAQNKVILASFTDAITTSFSMSVNGGSYVKADINMEAIDMSNNITYDAGGDNKGA